MWLKEYLLTVLLKYLSFQSLNEIFFFANKDPSPFPQTRYFLDFFFLILTPNFFRHLIVDNTSSDSNTLLIWDMLWPRELIKKPLIEIDLSESTFISLLNDGIFFSTIRLKLFGGITFMKIEIQNNVL